MASTSAREEIRPYIYWNRPYLMVQNRGVYMPIEVLATIASAAGLLVTLGGGLFAGFAWMLRRMEDQSIEVREEFRVVREDLHQIRRQLTEVTR